MLLCCNLFIHYFFSAMLIVFFNKMYRAPLCVRGRVLLDISDILNFIFMNLVVLSIFFHASLCVTLINLLG